jgi:hypothetical protein
MQYVSIFKFAYFMLQQGICTVVLERGDLHYFAFLSDPKLFSIHFLFPLSKTNKWVMHEG